MSADDELQEKFTAIGIRYLARTQGELAELRSHIERLRAGDPTAVKDIEVLAHRIHGSGAVFGFHDLSNAAGAIEMLAVETARDGAGDYAQIAQKAATLVEGVVQALQAAQATASR